MEIAEAIVFYHVLVTRAVILNKFAKGFQCLNVLPKIRKNPVQFEKVFLHMEDGINGTAVILRISFESEEPVTLKLKCFLNNASLEGTYVQTTAGPIRIGCPLPSLTSPFYFLYGHLEMHLKLPLKTPTDK